MFCFLFTIKSICLDFSNHEFGGNSCLIFVAKLVFLNKFPKKQMQNHLYKVILNDYYLSNKEHFIVNTTQDNAI